MFKELDKLNNNFSTQILSVVVSSIEMILLKKSDLITTIHEKLIANKLLSFLDRADQISGEKILSIINISLPNPTDKCS